MSKSLIGKIIFLAVLGVSLVLAFMAMVNAIGIMTESGFDKLPDASAGTISAAFWMYLGITIALVGCIVAIVLSMVGMGKIAPLVFMAAGAVAIICIIVSMVMNADYVKNLADAAKIAKAGGDLVHKAALMAHKREILIPILNMLIFGGMPIAFGLNKMLGKD